MSLANLDEKEREVIKECLRAAAEGPFFPDWEFQTLFGLERDEVKQVLACWPELNEEDESVVCAINNSLNNLLGYPAQNREELWPQYISATDAEVARIFDKWKGRTPPTSRDGRSYFEDLR